MIGDVSKHPKLQPEEQIHQTTVVQSNPVVLKLCAAAH